MIDIEKSREGMRRIIGAYAEDGNVSMSHIANLYFEALNELEALRKPRESVTSGLFDMVAAREEMKWIDVAWGSHDTDDKADAFRGARALLDKALEALEAGWPAVDIEGAAEAAREAHVSGKDTATSPAPSSMSTAGRKTDPTIVTDVPQSSPMGAASSLCGPIAITDAVVEEAAILAWCVDGTGRESWRRISANSRARWKAEARAVLEYAVSIGLAAPSKSRDVVPLPAVDPREERLTRYRCAAVIAFGATSTADEIEGHAHAMLRAERSPDAV